MISVSLALSQTPDYAARPQASASRGVPIYATAFAGTKLYRLTARGKWV